MVDIVIKTRKVTREQIAQAVGNNPRLIRLIESLAHDVTVSIPDAVSTVEAQSVFSLYPADGSKAIASRAEAAALQVETLMHTARSALSSAMHADALAIQVEALTQSARRMSGELAAARGEIEQLRAELHEARSRLISAVSVAQNTADSALTLQLGA